MGCDRNFTCVTCRKTYSLGYGSYGTWLDGGNSGINTFADFQASDSPQKTLRKNQNFGRCLHEHDGHQWRTWSFDYCSHKDGDLWVHAGYEPYVLISGEAAFEFVDLAEEA